MLCFTVSVNPGLYKYHGIFTLRCWPGSQIIRNKILRPKHWVPEIQHRCEKQCKGNHKLYLNGITHIFELRWRWTHHSTVAFRSDVYGVKQTIQICFVTWSDFLNFTVFPHADEFCMNDKYGNCIFIFYLPCPDRTPNMNLELSNFSRISEFTTQFWDYILELWV